MGTAQGMGQGEGCQLPRDRGGLSGCSAVCRTFCRGDAAEPALPVAALESSGAAGVTGTEWGLQAQAAHEVPWTPPRFLGVPCVGMAMSGQCQSPSSFIPGEAGCGSLQGPGYWSRDCSPGAGEFSASWPGAAGHIKTCTAQLSVTQCSMTCHGAVWHGPVCALTSATRSVTGPVRVKPAPSQHQLEVRIYS